MCLCPHLQFTDAFAANASSFRARTNNFGHFLHVEKQNINGKNMMSKQTAMLPFCETVLNMIADAYEYVSRHSNDSEFLAKDLEIDALSKLKQAVDADLYTLERLNAQLMDYMDD